MSKIPSFPSQFKTATPLKGSTAYNVIAQDAATNPTRLLLKRPHGLVWHALDTLSAR